MAVDPAPLKMPLIYRRNAPIAAILGDLAAIRTLDRASERGSSRWGAIGCLGIVCTAVTGFLFFPVAPLFLILGIVGGVLWWRNKRGDVENRRYELLARVLDLLARDTPRDTQVNVALDLRPPSHQDKFDRKGKVGPWDVKFYTDPWLTLQGRLLDGSAYRLTLIDRHQARSRTARSRSGKMKRKSKSKCATQAHLALKVKARRYPRLGELAGAAPSAVKLPEWATLKKLAIPTAAGARVSLHAVTKSKWDAPPPGQDETPQSGARLVAMMFLSLYEVLNLARPAKGV